MSKNKRIYKINRRDFLKGLGIISIPLPIFDFMLNANGTAYAQSNTAIPKRFINMKSGNAPAADYDNAVDITGNPRNLLVPLSFGANYQTSTATKSLDSYDGLKEYVGFFSNCAYNYKKLGSSQGSMASTPLGGLYGNFHETANYPMMTGRRIWATTPGSSNYNRDKGASADQLLKAALNPKGTTVHANYRAQFQGSPGRESMQYNSSGVEIQENSSPRSIFNELFSNFSDSTAVVNPAQNLAFDNRKSILDYLDKERVNFLKRNLASRDKIILTNHLDYIRDLELRVSSVAPISANLTCHKMKDPGSDPGLASDKYYNEDLRADLIIDLLAMAMACDIVRHGTFRITTDQSYLSSFPFTKKNANFHDLTHWNSANTNVTDTNAAVGWAASKFFKFANALKSLSEGSSNVLDNSAILYHSEGGHGPSVDEAGNSPVTHSTENLCIIVAGKAGNLKTGSHVKTNRAHPIAVTLAAMKAVGYQGNTIGDITGHEPLVWNG